MRRSYRDLCCTLNNAEEECGDRAVGDVAQCESSLLYPSRVGRWEETIIVLCKNEV